MKRFLLIFFSIILVIACSEITTSDEYLTRAKRSIDAKNYKKAIIDLKNVLQNESDNADARLLLANAYFELGNFPSSYKEFSIANELGINKALTLPYMIRANFFMGNFKDLDENLAQVDLLDDANKSMNKVVIGLNYIYLGKTQQGFALLSEVLKQPKDQVDDFYSQLAKMSVASKDDQLPQAISSIAVLAEQDNEFNDALLLQSKLLFLDQQLSKATTSYQEYLVLQPYNYLIRMEYAQILMHDNQLEQADKVITGLLINYPSHPISNGLKAEILFRQKNFDESIKFADKALLYTQDNLKLNLISGVSYFQLKNFEMAYNQLISIEEKLPKNHPAYNILLDLKFRLGYMDEALVDLNARSNFSEKDMNILTKASLALLSQGNNQQAEQYVGRMGDEITTSAQSLNLRGNLKLEMNNPGGYDDLQKAIELEPGYIKPRLALLYNYLKDNNYKAAMDLAQDWQQTTPDNNLGDLAIGIVYLRQGNQASAKTAFNQALQKNPESIGALYNLAVIAQKELQFDNALNGFNEILKINPGHKGALLRLTDMLSEPLVADKTLDLLASTKAQHPKNINLGVSYALALYQTNNLPMALGELEQLKNYAFENPRYIKTYADLLKEAKKFDKAELLYLQYLDLQPQQLSRNVDYLNILERQGKLQQAISQVQKMQQSFADNLNLYLYEAKLALADGNLLRATNLLESANQDKIDMAFYNRLNFSLNIKKKDFTSATIYAQRLYSDNPTNDNTFNYARVLKNTNENHAALKVVEEYLTSHPEDERFQQLLAAINTEVNPEKSISYYQGLLQKNPDNYIVLNNLAWSAIMAEQYDLAVKEAKKAVDLSKRNPLVLDTLAVAYLRLGKLKEAERILTGVAKDLPQNQQVNLHLAEVLIYLKRIDESKALLDKLQDGPKKQQVMDLISKT